MNNYRLLYRKVSDWSGYSGTLIDHSDWFVKHSGTSG